MIRFDKETKRRFGVFSLINVAVLLVAYGALFICFGFYVSDSGDRAAEKLAREYAEELQGYSYAELVSDNAPESPYYLYAIYTVRGDGEYELSTPSDFLRELNPFIGGETDKVQIQTFTADDGTSYEFATYTTRLDDPSGERYLKLFVPDRIADETLADIGGGSIAFVCVFVVLAVVLALVMGYIQMRPIVASYSEQKAFVNDMSHEIRTPLAIIRGNLDNVLASDAVTDDAAREDLQACLKEIDYMTDISSGLLNIVRAGNKSAGKDGSVSDTVASVVDMYADLANMDNKALIACIDSTQLSLDRDKVKQLTSILLDNAVKYTREGDRISVRLKNTTGGGCVLTVADTGIGIPKGDEEKIFDRFYRASNVGDIQGTGLGLSIAKATAESLGGTIRARQNAPSGLEITVEFARR